MNCFNCEFATNKGQRKCVCSLMKKIVDSDTIHPRCPIKEELEKEELLKKFVEELKLKIYQQEQSIGKTDPELIEILERHLEDFIKDN